MAFTLHTLRLTLQDFVEADLTDVIDLRRDPIVLEFMDFPTQSPDETREWLRSVIHHNGLIPRTSYNLAIMRRGEDRMIGWVGFGDSSRYPGPENFGVGYMLAHDVWGKGYATETLQSVTSFIFSRLDGTFVSAQCHADNLAPARVMEKSGMHFIRRLERPDPKTGSMVERREFGIHREATT
ncbi:MAG: GNAT family N-acetyltransferase [Thermomicrobiales bacterium]